MKANQFLQNIKQDKSGYMKIVGGLVALLLTIIIGVLVFWEVDDSIELDSADGNTSKEGVEDMASTVFGLLPLIALVVVASIILGVVIGFGGKK